MAGHLGPTVNRSGCLFPSGARGPRMGVSFSRTAEKPLDMGDSSPQNTTLDA
jgi:hypothetical protein